MQGISNDFSNKDDSTEEEYQVRFLLTPNISASNSANPSASVSTNTSVVSSPNPSAPVSTYASTEPSPFPSPYPSPPQRRKLDPKTEQDLKNSIVKQLTPTTSPRKTESSTFKSSLDPDVTTSLNIYRDSEKEPIPLNIYRNSEEESIPLNQQAHPHFSQSWIFKVANLVAPPAGNLLIGLLILAAAGLKLFAQEAQTNNPFLSILLLGNAINGLIKLFFELGNKNNKLNGFFSVPAFIVCALIATGIELLLEKEVYNSQNQNYPDQRLNSALGVTPTLANLAYETGKYLSNFFPCPNRCQKLIKPEQYPLLPKQLLPS